MIEITERQAVAINAAAKVVKASKLENNPIKWLRGIDLTREKDVYQITVHFWINGDPKCLATVRVVLVRDFDGWVATIAVIEGPKTGKSGKTEHLWAFNYQGDPMKIH